jgi:hypothetical protein
MKSEAPAGTGATHNGRKEHIAGDRQFEVVNPSGEYLDETAGLLEAVASVVANAWLTGRVTPAVR